MYLGISQAEADDYGYRGTNEGSKLAGNASLWYDGDLKNIAAFGTSGFSALPGGYRDYYDGSFSGMGHDAHFWSATENNTGYVWSRELYYHNSEMCRNDYNKHFGFSVRLVRD